MFERRARVGIAVYPFFSGAGLQATRAVKWTVLGEGYLRSIAATPK